MANSAGPEDIGVGLAEVGVSPPKDEAYCTTGGGLPKGDHDAGALPELALTSGVRVDALGISGTSTVTGSDGQRATGG